MSTFPILRLQAGKEVHIRNKHHAVFKSAVATFPDCPNGSILAVGSSRNEFLCYALVDRDACTCGRAS